MTLTERKVEAPCREHTPVPLRQDEQQARAEAQQCQEKKARLQAECSGQGGLTGLIANKWMDEKGSSPGCSRKSPHARQIPSKRRRSSATGPLVLVDGGRVAVEVELRNLGAEAWTPTGASLGGAQREKVMGLPVAPLKPIPPGMRGNIVVEMDATEDEARGSYTLPPRTGHLHTCLLRVPSRSRHTPPLRRRPVALGSARECIPQPCVTPTAPAAVAPWQVPGVGAEMIAALTLLAGRAVGPRPGVLG